MHVTRAADAPTYEAPGHYGMAAMRLQGHDVSDTRGFWVGLSHFLPGGGAEGSSAPLERVYVGIAGEVTVVTEDGEAVLRALDSCYLAAGERREVVNRTTLPASMLVIMTYPEG
jgi:glyoxylate utilization-related uncharacterized protein